MVEDVAALRENVSAVVPVVSFKPSPALYKWSVSFDVDVTL